jgi:uncharacterized repeat protein (TIGR03803 family)
MKNLCIALLTGAIGCVLVQTIPVAASQFEERVLYSFCSQKTCADGARPIANLVDMNGVLYSTTSNGGIEFCQPSPGCGIAFSFDPSSGIERVLHAFCSRFNGNDCLDGALPAAGLIDVTGNIANTTLYGTTSWGGPNCPSQEPCGTVFALDPTTGAEWVLYSFCSQYMCTDGAFPVGRLIDVNGMLYGTTDTGGSGGYGGQSLGTVFALDPKTGDETVLHTFCQQQKCTDGQNPTGVIDVNGILYGTLAGGGSYLRGAVFSLDLSTGAESLVYSFGTNSPDGTDPAFGLTDINGTLYGTTFGGGIDGCGGFGCGTVFSIDPGTGVETTLYSFCQRRNCTDGATPLANPVALNGVLYGTTAYGGAIGCGGSGCGTVFSLDPGTDAEKVLYAFCSQQNCADGASPSASLIIVNGKFYGTTAVGGTIGQGTVFVLKKKR